jgi:poly(3-hydroxybutyrate) depolymerase
MVFDWLCEQSRAVSSTSLAIPPTRQQWQDTLDGRRQQWLEMLGLWPLPERTELQATVTGTLDRGDYVVEKVHFQSVPGAYVPGNLYRPANISGPLPAVLYLCGHTKGKVNAPYQANPRWFGQHGYVALVLDPIQLGEAQGFHHGTYHQGRWDWLSRGYTPTGVEVWNAMRALDYLESRDDVDAQRMGVTGLSGGGSMSWALGAADERVKCVAPSCQTGTMEQVICDRAIDGHCDCTFWINYYRWCTPDVGALIAPRPLLVTAGTDDTLWRPYAFRETVYRVRRLYEKLGVADNCQLVEDLTPHGYSPRLRKAIFSWFDRHLKGSDEPVTDDITDFVEPEENLLVFGGKLPENDHMQTICDTFVPMAQAPEVADLQQWEAHREATLERLRTLTFRHMPCTDGGRISEARVDGAVRDGGVFYSYRFDVGDGMSAWARLTLPAERTEAVDTLVGAMHLARSHYVGGREDRPSVAPGLATAMIEVRGTGATQMGEGIAWTVRRGCQLVGFSLPERQTADLLGGLATVRSLDAVAATALYGKGPTAVLAIYAAIFDEEVTELVLEGPPGSHTDPDTPEMLGVLRIGDLPQNLALVFPRPITFVGEIPAAYGWTKRLYEKLDHADRIRTVASVRDWSAAR